MQGTKLKGIANSNRRPVASRCPTCCETNFQQSAGTAWDGCTMVPCPSCRPRSPRWCKQLNLALAALGSPSCAFWQRMPLASTNNNDFQIPRCKSSVYRIPKEIFRNQLSDVIGASRNDSSSSLQSARPFSICGFSEAARLVHHKGPKSSPISHPAS